MRVIIPIYATASGKPLQGALITAALEFLPGILEDAKDFTRDGGWNSSLRLVPEAYAITRVPNSIDIGPFKQPDKFLVAVLVLTGNVKFPFVVDNFMDSKNERLNNARDLQEMLDFFFDTRLINVKRAGSTAIEFAFDAWLMVIDQYEGASPAATKPKPVKTPVASQRLSSSSSSSSPAAAGPAVAAFDVDVRVPIVVQITDDLQEFFGDRYTRIVSGQYGTNLMEAAKREAKRIQNEKIFTTLNVTVEKDNSYLHDTVQPGVYSGRIGSVVMKGYVPMPLNQKVSNSNQLRAFFGSELANMNVATVIYQDSTGGDGEDYDGGYVGQVRIDARFGAPTVILRAIQQAKPGSASKPKNSKPANRPKKQQGQAPVAVAMSAALAAPAVSALAPAAAPAVSALAPAAAPAISALAPANSEYYYLQYAVPIIVETDDFSAYGPDIILSDLDAQKLNQIYTAAVEAIRGIKVMTVFGYKPKAAQQPPSFWTKGFSLQENDGVIVGYLQIVGKLKKDAYALERASFLRRLRDNLGDKPIWQTFSSYSTENELSAKLAWKHELYQWVGDGSQVATPPANAQAANSVVVPTAVAAPGAQGDEFRVAVRVKMEVTVQEGEIEDDEVLTPEMRDKIIGKVVEKIEKKMKKIDAPASVVVLEYDKRLWKSMDSDRGDDDDSGDEEEEEGGAIQGAIGITGRANTGNSEESRENMKYEILGTLEYLDIDEVFLEAEDLGTDAVAQINTRLDVDNAIFKWTVPVLVSPATLQKPSSGRNKPSLLDKPYSPAPYSRSGLDPDEDDAADLAQALYESIKRAAEKTKSRRAKSIGRERFVQYVLSDRSTQSFWADVSPSQSKQADAAEYLLRIVSVEKDQMLEQTGDLELDAVLNHLWTMLNQSGVAKKVRKYLM